MHANPYIAFLTIKPCSSKSTCTTDLILLQKKALGTQNNMIQKHGYLKMQDCSRFSHIRLHINSLLYVFIFISVILSVAYMVFIGLILRGQLLEWLPISVCSQMSFSPNTAMYNYAKIIASLLLIILTCSGLYMVCAVVGWQYGIGYFLFLISEVNALCCIVRAYTHIYICICRVGGNALQK